MPGFDAQSWTDKELVIIDSSQAQIVTREHRSDIPDVSCWHYGEVQER